jgi:hypothetical protein
MQGQRAFEEIRKKYRADREFMRDHPVKAAVRDRLGV